MWGENHIVGRVKDVLRQVRRSIIPKEGSSYKLVGVKLYAKGATIQGEFSGADLKAPTLNCLEPGDITYNKMWASKGTFAIINESLGKCFCTSEYPIFNTLGDNDAAFIMRVLSEPRFWARAEAWSSGSTDRSRLNPIDFLTLPVPVPKPDEQRAIAELLQCVDIAISQTEELISQLKETKRAIMRELLTLGLDRTMASLVPLNKKWVLGRVAEGMTHIPKGWNLVRLTTVAKLESGHTPSRKVTDYWNGEIPWLSLSDTDLLDGIGVQETNELVTELGIKNSSARVLPIDTVVLSRTATVGKSAKLLVPSSTSQDFANWICGPKLSPDYLVQVFRHMRREWLRLQAGSTHQTIYMPVFKRLQVLVPPLEQQKQIAVIGNSFDRRIEAEENSVKVLNSCRAGLAQELISGRVRLPQSMIARHIEPTGRAA